MRFFIPRFVAVLLLYVFLTAVGVVGYAWIEGWGLWNSLYMTVITLTAVGSAEVNPLSEAGQGFTRKSGAESHDFVFNPVAETRLEPGDEIIVLGRPDQIVALRKYVRP